MIAFGASDMTKAYVGSTEGSKAYLGDELVWGGSSPALPYDAEIEYLQSDGTQYIDTGVVDNGNMTIKTKINVLLSTTKSKFSMLYGYHNGWNKSARNLRTQRESNNKVYIQYGSNNESYHTVNAQQLVIVDSPTSVVINNTNIKTRTAQTITNSLHFYIFASNPTLSTLSNANIKIYYFQMLSGSTLLLDMIPVRVGTTGYMYDKVSGELFGNAGSGSFTLGPDVS